VLAVELSSASHVGWSAKCCVFTHCDKLCACATDIYCSTANREYS